MSESLHSVKGKFIEERWFKKSEEGLVLVGSRCEACKKVFFPEKEVCPHCFDGELKEVPLSKRGRLHSYALSVMGPLGMKTPYVIGFIDLPEGIKLFSILTDCEPWKEVLRIGMEMEMIIRSINKDKNGTEIQSYQFRPIKGEANR